MYAWKQQSAVIENKLHDCSRTATRAESLIMVYNLFTAVKANEDAS
jgi:hypothetical protein